MAACKNAGANDAIEWTGEFHEFRGNILFADGRVELFNNAGLLATITHSPVGQDTFLPPITAPPNPGERGGRCSVLREHVRSAWRAAGQQ